MGWRGAHKYIAYTYRFDLWKCSENEGVDFRPSQLFLTEVVVRGPYCKIRSEIFPVDLWPKREGRGP